MKTREFWKAAFPMKVALSVVVDPARNAITASRLMSKKKRLFSK
jgi:hypothetical protein